LSSNLLIVDDEEMIRDLLTMTLSRQKYNCFQSSNAEEGLKILRERDIDLALLDVMMPGTSGLELLRDLKAVSPDTAVLMITALSDMETALNCIHLGADDYITKPFSIENIVLKANNALEKRRLIQETANTRMNLSSKF